jgi:hypothetical protein
VSWYKTPTNKQNQTKRVKNTTNFIKMKKKAKKCQGKRTRGAPRRQQIPSQDPSPAPSWIRPWVLTSTTEYDERTTSAARFAENEEYCRWNGITPRTEEEEKEYNHFLETEFHQLGARDRERAAAYAEAERFREREVQAETERRDRIAAKAAKKKAAAKAAADAAAKAEAEAARQREEQSAQLAEREDRHRRQVASAAREAAAAARQRQEQRQRVKAVAKVAAADGSQRQRRRHQHRRVVHAAADAARRQIKIQIQAAIINQPSFSENEYPSQETPYHREAATMADKDQGGEYAPTRVPVETKPAEEETIEEMVRRIERELDEFSRLFTAATPTAAAAATAPRVPGAETELETMEVENKQFANSFVEIEKIKVPPEPPDLKWKGMEKVDQQPRRQHRATEMAGAAEPSERIVPGGHAQQRPPQIEPAERPPPERDRVRGKYKVKGCGARQLKGCRRGRYSQSTSAKGVLDTKYLCPRPRVRGRIPIEDWRPPTGTQRARLHGRSVFGRPAQ